MLGGAPVDGTATSTTAWGGRREPSTKLAEDSGPNADVKPKQTVLWSLGIVASSLPQLRPTQFMRLDGLHSIAEDILANLRTHLCIVHHELKYCVVHNVTYDLR